MNTLDVELNKILADFVTGDINDMPVEQIKELFKAHGWVSTDK